MTGIDDPTRLTAVEAAGLIRDGHLKSADLTAACLAKIDRTDGDLQAWRFVDADRAMERAKQADVAKARGGPLGPLHGVPVGVKDIIDTAGMPTENGTALHEGRRPGRNAAVVDSLAQAGAIVLGKTVTTELAVLHPGPTRNPHDPAHTPGGSSSGSAAAVAAFQVPVAIGTQTNGSVIRPSAFCGVVGFKPTHGAIPRAGVLKQSPPLDTIGTMGRTVEDAALLADVLFGHHPADPATRPTARADLLRIAGREAPVPPRLAFVRTPVWDKAAEATRESFEGLAEALGDQVTEVVLPNAFDRLWDMHKQVMSADLAKNFADEYARGAGVMSETLREMIAFGQTVTAVDYNRALDWREVFLDGLGEVFDEFDAILTPAAAGEAPEGLDATGDPSFCTAWTFCGTPAVTLPLLSGPKGLPLGVQLVGPRFDDARLLRTARDVAGRVARLAEAA